MERRKFIQMSIAATGGITVAGCSDFGGGSDGENGENGNGNGNRTGNGTSNSEFPEYDVPVYSDWPPDSPRTKDFVMFTHMNITHLHGEDSGQTETQTQTQTEDDEDMLISLPVYGLSVTALWFHLGLWGYPWEGTLGSEDEPDSMETESITMTEGTFIFHGEYDPSAFSERFANGYEEREEGEFTVLAGRPDEGNEDFAYAVSETSVVAVIAPEQVPEHDAAVGILKDALTKYVDEAERVADTEEGQWMFETTGDADAVMGVWQVDGLESEDIQPRANQENASDQEQEPDAFGDSPVFENVDSFTSMLTLPESEGGVGGDSTAVRFAAIYPDGEVPDEGTLREELAPSLDEESLTIRKTDARAHVAAEVSADEIDATE